MLFITLCVSNAVLTLSLILYYRFIFPIKTTKRIKDQIIKNGIIHFTTKEAAKKINESQELKANKIKEVYFFINDYIDENIYQYNVEKHRKKIENAILISNFTEKQMKRFKYRFFDEVIIYKSLSFQFASENVVEIKDSEYKTTTNENTFLRKKFNYYHCIHYKLLFLTIFSWLTLPTPEGGGFLTLHQLTTWFFYVHFPAAHGRYAKI